MATKETDINAVNHVLIMITDVCKGCGGPIKLTGNVFEYVFAHCQTCGKDFIAGHLALEEQQDLEVVSG